VHGVGKNKPTDIDNQSSLASIHAIKPRLGLRR
jgi:hypothetical protein